MYRINLFSKMVGLSPSKIRFYEKYGLLKVKRDSNGYRYFTHHDAFRVNAFRVLMLYGFTVEQAVQMLDQKQTGNVFVQSLKKQKEKLERDIKLMRYRQKKIDQVIELLNNNEKDNFEIKEVEDYLYVLASNGLDFSISDENAESFARFAELLPISAYARIIMKEDLLSNKNVINPSYGAVISCTMESELGEYDCTKVKRLKMGTCVHFVREKTREGSAKKESFKGLFEFLKKNNYEIAGDVLLLPTFLNLDGRGNSIEILYVPIKNLTSN